MKKFVRVVVGATVVTSMAIFAFSQYQCCRKAVKESENVGVEVSGDADVGAGASGSAQVEEPLPREPQGKSD